MAFRRGGNNPMGKPLAIYSFAIIFSLIGLGLMVGLTGWPLMQWASASSWVEVPCTITRSEVDTHHSSDGNTFSVDIAYTYTVDGQEYASNRYIFQGGSSSGYNRKAEAVAAYPVGSTQRCFVNPEDPTDAVLNRDFNLAYLIGLFGLPFLLFGLGVGFFGRRMGSGLSISRRGAKHADVVGDREYRSDAVTLKGKGGRRMGCIFMFIFGAIWNSIVIGMLVAMFQDGGDVEWFAVFFLIPFLLIGIGVAGAFIYFFLAQFNPRPELELSTGYLPLGGSAELRWTFQGNPGRISQLTITLCGAEKATYRRGTSTVTDDSVFVKQVLVETGVLREIMAGRVSLAIPEFSAPTFGAANNKIVWYIQVHGDIKRWPDVNEAFEFTVAPLPVGAHGAPPPAPAFRPT